jgi:hypothetical protein
VGGQQALCLTVGRIEANCLAQESLGRVQPALFEQHFRKAYPAEGARRLDRRHLAIAVDCLLAMVKGLEQVSKLFQRLDVARRQSHSLSESRDGFAVSAELCQRDPGVVVIVGKTGRKSDSAQEARQRFVGAPCVQVNQT